MHCYLQPRTFRTDTLGFANKDNHSPFMHPYDRSKHRQKHKRMPLPRRSRTRARPFAAGHFKELPAVTGVSRKCLGGEEVGGAGKKVADKPEKRGTGSGQHGHLRSSPASLLRAKLPS